MRMKKEYAVLMVIIAVLSAYLLLHRKDRTNYELPTLPAVAKGDITRISLKKADSEIVLERKEGGWSIGPKGYPADEGKVGRIIDSIAGLRLTALASETRNYALYDLDDSDRIEVTAYRKDGAVRTIDIGKAASSYRHTFVRLKGDPRVYYAAGNLRNVFDTTVQALRDRVVMKFNADEITELELWNGKERMRFVKQEATAPASGEDRDKGSRDSVWKTADGRPAKGGLIAPIISALSDLSCDEFIEDRGRDDLGRASFSVTLKGTKEYTLSLFAKRDGRYDAVSSESAYPFRLSDWKARQIMKDPATLIDKEK